jgi:hypothetical protein
MLSPYSSSKVEYLDREQHRIEVAKLRQHEPDGSATIKEYDYGHIKIKSILGSDIEATVRIGNDTHTFDLGNLISWLKKKDSNLVYWAIEKRLKG